MISFFCYLIHDIISLRILNIHFASFVGREMVSDNSLFAHGHHPFTLRLPWVVLWSLTPATRISRLLCYWFLVGSASGRHWQWLKDGGREGGVCVSSSFPPALSSGCMSSQALPLLHGSSCHCVSGVCITSSLYHFRHRSINGLPGSWTLGTSPCLVSLHSAHISEQKSFIRNS